jgi:hypothetical protein
MSGTIRGSFGFIDKPDLYKFADFDTNLSKINYFPPNANEKFRFSGDSSPVVFPR